MTVPPLLSQFSCTKAFFACIHLFMWCIIIITLTVWYLLVNFLLPVQGSCSLKTDSKVEYTSTLNHKPNQLFFSVYNNGKQAAVIFTYEILFHAENSNSESIEWAWNLTKTRFIIRWSQEQYKIYFRISIPHLSVYITCHLLGKMTVHTGSRNCHELRLIAPADAVSELLFFWIIQLFSQPLTYTNYYFPIDLKYLGSLYSFCAFKSQLLVSSFPALVMFVY